jgi:hypothetical protein
MTPPDILQAIKDAITETLSDGIRRMAMTAQQPAVIASESGRTSLELKMLATDKIQWGVHWYQTGDDPYDFVEDAFYITDQIATFLHNHKPGDPLILKLERLHK